MNDRSYSVTFILYTGEAQGTKVTHPHKVEKTRFKLKQPTAEPIYLTTVYSCILDKSKIALAGDPHREL